MNGFLLFIAGYFILGIIVLVLFDLVTRRIRRNWEVAVADTLAQLSNIGMGLGFRQGEILIGFVMWLLWPAVIYGAVKGRKKGKNGEKS